MILTPPPGLMANAALTAVEIICVLSVLAAAICHSGGEKSTDKPDKPTDKAQDPAACRNPMAAWKYVQPVDVNTEVKINGTVWKFCAKCVCSATGKVGFYNKTHVTRDHKLKESSSDLPNPGGNLSAVAPDSTKQEAKVDEDSSPNPNALVWDFSFSFSVFFFYWRS